MKKEVRTYNAHETHRMQQVHGMPLASFYRRAAAFALDFVIAFLLFLAFLLYVLPPIAKLGWISIPEDANLQFDLKHWYSLIPLVIYFSLWIYFTNGKTPGKMLMRIRVISLVHEKMSLWHSTERALGYAASALEAGFGFFQYFIHPNRRTVHDRIAETVVVREPERARKRKKRTSDDDE